MQGGYLLSSIKRDVRPMREALRAALGYLDLYRLSTEGEVGRTKDRLDRLI
jgi:hypothetical protein